MFLFSCKHTQKLFFELTEICVYVTNPLICKLFFFRVRLACILVYLLIYSVSMPRLHYSVIFRASRVQTCILWSLSLKQTQAVTGSILSFFFYLRKAMEILIIFYLCLSSLRNFILSVIFFSIPMK